MKWKDKALLLCQAHGDTGVCALKSCVSQPGAGGGGGDLVRSFIAMVQGLGC